MGGSWEAPESPPRQGLPSRAVAAKQWQACDPVGLRSWTSPATRAIERRLCLQNPGASKEARSMSEVSAAGGLRKAPFLDRLLDSLLDPGRRERTVLALLAAYAAIWSLYGTIAKSSQDIHFDMGEMIAWSREVTLGT